MIMSKNIFSKLLIPKFVYTMRGTFDRGDRLIPKLQKEGRRIVKFAQKMSNYQTITDTAKMRPQK